MIDRELMERLAKVFPRPLDVDAAEAMDECARSVFVRYLYDRPTDPFWGIIAYTIDQEFLAAGADVALGGEVLGACCVYSARFYDQRGVRASYSDCRDSFMEARIRAYLKWKEGEKE